MHLVWFIIWFDFDKILVDKSDFECPARNSFVKQLLQIKSGAAVVVHVEIDTHELLHQVFEDVQVAPSVVHQVNLHDNHIDVVKLLNGEVLESRPLASFNVDLKYDVLFEQFSALEDFKQGHEL